MLTRLFKQGANFKCIGSKCIDSCCAGWDITFDKSTYEKMSHDPCFKKTMDDYAYINDNISLENINHGIVSLTNAERCPFLDKDNLCSVQKSRGEDELSNVCALYPRYYNLLDGFYEESLSLACIEATEKLLLGDSLELDEIDRGPKRDVVILTIDTLAKHNDNSPMSCLYEFRKLIFGLLKIERHTFNEKLGMLMTFHEHLEAVDENFLKTTLESYDFSSKVMSLSIDEAVYKRIIDFLKTIGISGHAELDNLINECIKDTNYNALKLDKLPSIDKIMSNYLIHQMFKDLYPFIAMHNKMDSFQYLLKKVQILRVLIAYDGHFDEKRVARIIQMYSKGLEHHASFHYELDDLIV